MAAQQGIESIAMPQPGGRQAGMRLDNTAALQLSAS